MDGIVNERHADGSPDARGSVSDQSGPVDWPGSHRRLPRRSGSRASLSWTDLTHSGPNSIRSRRSCWEAKMKSKKSVGRIVGMLLLLHLAVGLTVPFILLDQVRRPAGLLAGAAGNAAQVRTAVLLLFVGSAISI